MSDLISRQDAVDAVLNLSEKVADEMLFIDAIVDEIENIPSAEQERTAKVKKRFMLVTGGMGDTLPLCECGFIVSDKWTYCPSCGARLEWNETD